MTRPHGFTPISELETHPHPFVAVPALCAYWQIDDRTLRNWIYDGYLPAYRLGRRWRVKTADALAFQERHRGALPLKQKVGNERKER